MTADEALDVLRDQRDWHGRYPADDPFPKAVGVLAAELERLRGRAKEQELRADKNLEDGLREYQRAEAAERDLAVARQELQAYYDDCPGCQRSDDLRQENERLTSMLATYEAIVETVENMDCECEPEHERGDYPDREAFVCNRCVALSAVDRAVLGGEEPG